MSRWTLALLPLLALALPPPAAHAQEIRVAVIPLSGTGGAIATPLVRRAAEEHAVVVEANEPDPHDPAGRADLARRMNVSLLITGSVSGTRRRPRISLEFIDARGQERATQRGPVPPGARGRRALRRMMRRAFASLGPLPTAEPEPEPEPIYQPPPAAVAAPVEEEVSVPERDGYRPWLRLLAGISLRNRNARVNLPGGRMPLRHNIPAYPELLIDAELRPLASLGDDALYGLLVSARFEYALFWSSSDRFGNEFGGSQYGFSGAVGYLASVHEVVQIGASIGGGYSTYQLDPNPYYPSVDHAHFEIRALSRFPVLDELLVLRAEAAYRYARGGDALAAQFGSIDANGVALAAGAGGTVLLSDSVGFDWGFDLEWNRLFMEFGDDGSEMARRAFDELLRGRFLVGISTQ